MAVSVTTRVDEVKQPRGGYVPLRSFEVETLEDGITLAPKENLAPGVIGTVVDNLTKLLVKPVYWASGDPQPATTPQEAFNIALAGARMLPSKHFKAVSALVDEIHGLDDRSIRNACMLSTYDAFYRAGINALVEPERLIPDECTTQNVRVMVNRCLSFFEKNGPVTYVSPTFKGGYTPTVPGGDGDLVTNDTIWDLKVMKGKPKTKHTLQLYMYYLMGKRSNQIEFFSVENLGFYNPRLNMAYRLDVSNISPDVKDAVEYDVIGYSGPAPELVAPGLLETIEKELTTKKNPLESLRDTEPEG